ncbi:NAD-dependent DNA ligase LigA [Mycoplasmopsis felis]|uniref:NAD-dependent DNA ligase LigA n=1 Tax=Mycoplasmopsis felis TaxID=33923 RepID=UPI002AFF9076|nr:NAD-dependent DNA ligase LigA [Mycoplasmopsis felis]WQQ07117.1 NAD-dependent DNA ligase LigA [Mycoplasmopsis felis]
MSDSKNIKNKIKELVEQLNRWDWEYYMLNEPSVSDEVYDNFYRELEVLEQQFPDLIMSNSPTQNIGQWNNNKFAKFKHKKLMLSLNKAFSKEDLFKFLNETKENLKINNLSFSLEPKIDGLSISLHYQNGRLIKAITRGNGVQGDDVTKNVFQISELPKEIPFLKDIEIRGEVYLSKSQFEKINKQLLKNNQKTFSNPRNAASGTLKLLNPETVKERGLSILLYDIVNASELGFVSQEELLNTLKSWNIPTNSYIKNISDFNQIWDYVIAFKELKNSFDYDCDGFVIKVNNLKYWDELGQTSKFPKYAIAFKYETEEKVGLIKKITATVGRTGKITYLAHFNESLELNQTMVSNATLHNYEFINEMKINEGDEVLVIKSGEIIPKVIGLVKKNTDTIFRKLEKCPSCSFELLTKEGFVDQFCVNENCHEKRIRSLIHFCSNQAMNIETLGSEIIRTFYEKGFLTDILSIYRLSDYKENIVQLNSFGSSIKNKNTDFKKYNNIINSINQSKKTTVDTLLFAIGIPNIGKNVAKLISQKINKISDLLTLDLDTLLEINTIGNIIISSIKNFISIPENINLIKKLDEIIEYQENQEKVSNTLENLTFVITGTLSESRDYFKNIIEQNGGKVTNTISKNTNYLLVGENPGSKIEKANKLNIKIINETEFDSILSNK